MESATQQNTALVEQMSAAAIGLKSQAQELVEVVAVLQIGKDVDSCRASHAPVQTLHPDRAVAVFGSPRVASFTSVAACQALPSHAMVPNPSSS